MSLSTRLTSVAVGLGILTIILAVLGFLALLDVLQAVEQSLALERAVLWLVLIAIIPVQITMIWTVVRLRASVERAGGADRS
ncbi:MAG: hypothetical protein GF405_03135 [Candidatus Eisenbacteria bacterium]|nr:hypothetical protein [Candidatus Eisenbacteria bacterium]